MKPSRSAVLLIHFRDNKYTKACLDSLQKADPSTPFITYVLAVQCPDETWIKNHKLNPKVISTQQNLGFSWANNMLIKQAQADGCQTFVALNNDTTVDPGFLKPLLLQLKKKSVGLVCPKIYFYPGCEFHLDSYSKKELGKVIWYMGGLYDKKNVFASHWGVNEVDHGQFNQVVETDFATGCCVAFNTNLIETVGLMNEHYFLYLEDLEWSLRVKKRGLKIIVEPQSIVYHKNAGSTGGSGSTTQQYYQTRNRLHFGLRHAPPKTRFHLLKNAIHDLKSSKNPIIKKATRDALTATMGPQSF
jgi:GT2 family glycosyltransferase